MQEETELKRYMGLKLALASQLVSLCAVAERRGSKMRARECEEMLAKLAEDRFTLAVVGQFKRGKSSLMNALIGRELLPTGVLPLTSAITSLRFGPSERLVLQHETSQWPEVAPISRLREYVTEEGNPGNYKRIKAAVVEVPLAFLRRGLEFVDTPGVGSSVSANTETTHAFIPACDSVVFVTGADTPLTETELDFLGTIRRYVHKVFFVVNKTDLLGERELGEVLGFVTRTLSERMGTEAVRIFPLSCARSLHASAAGDDAARAHSGISQLQEELGRFLSDERAVTLLGAISERALRLAAAELREVDLSKWARDLPARAAQDRRRAVQDEWTGLAAQREAIFRDLRTRLMAELQDRFAAEARSAPVDGNARGAERIARLCEGCSWRTTVQRVAQREAAHRRRQLARRFSNRREGWRLAVPSLFPAEWDKLQANVGRISAVAVSLTGSMNGADPNAEMLPPSSTEVKLEEPLAADFSAQVTLPWWLRVLPARMAGSRVVSRLARQIAAALDAQRSALLLRAESAANGALDRLRDEVERTAGQIESRLLGTLKGERAEEGDDTALASVRQSLVALRGEIAGWSTTAMGPAAAVAALQRLGTERKPITSPAQTRPPPISNADLEKDLRTRGCPVCNHLHDAAFRLFTRLQYELFENDEARSRFAFEGGFCPLHAWQLEAVSSPVGSSVGYPPLVHHVAHRLAHASQEPGAERIVRGLIRDSTTCRACRLLRDAERSYSERLAHFLSEPEGRPAYGRSQGVCLRHLALLVAAPCDEGANAFVLSHAARRFEDLAEDMQAFAMKTEALRRSLRNKDEEDAFWRAITHVAGARSVAMPWQEEMQLGG